MDLIKNLTITKNATIIDAMQIIQNGSLKIALVVDKQYKLIGTISDGDIRRALINNYHLEDTIENIINTSPSTCTINEPKEKIIQLALSKKLHLIPIVTNDNTLIGIEEIDKLLSPEPKENKVILMVGGLGTRLQPLTNDIPKPLLKVGEKPILETIIENFAKYGLTNITLCVNYKAEMIENHFGDGSTFGVNIEYIYEKKRLGTAGALSLLKDTLEEPFFVMNGDLLTDLNFQHMLNFHTTNQSDATMCLREMELQIQYGVVETKDNDILSLVEKPIHKYFVNAGIYILNPELLQYIPKDKFFDMPTLFEKAIKTNNKVTSYIHHGYWIDIGQLNDYKKANLEYKEYIS